MGCGVSRPIKKKRHFLGLSLKKTQSPIIIIPKPENETQAFFVDNEFEPAKDTQIKWMRPHQMVSEPALYVDGTSRRDVIQGILGKSTVWLAFDIRGILNFNKMSYNHLLCAILPLGNRKIIEIFSFISLYSHLIIQFFSDFVKRLL